MVQAAQQPEIGTNTGFTGDVAENAPVVFSTPVYEVLVNSETTAYVVRNKNTQVRELVTPYYGQALHYVAEAMAVIEKVDPPLVQTATELVS